MGAWLFCETSVRAATGTRNAKNAAPQVVQVVADVMVKGLWCAHELFLLGPAQH